MKKWEISAYILSLILVLFYPLFTPPGVSLSQIETSFAAEQSGLQIDEYAVPFFNLLHLHFQMNKGFSIQKQNTDSGELYDFMNLEVSRTPQFHSYILKKILEVQDRMAVENRFQQAATAVHLQLFESDFSSGDNGAFAYSAIAYFKIDENYYAASTSLWASEAAQSLSGREFDALAEQAEAEVQKLVRQIQKGNSTP